MRFDEDVTFPRDEYTVVLRSKDGAYLLLLELFPTNRETSSTNPAAKPDDEPKPFKPGNYARQIRESVGQAKRNLTRVLLFVGRNDNKESVLLEELLRKDKKIAKILQYEYALVYVGLNYVDPESNGNRVLAPYIKDATAPSMVVIDENGKELVSINCKRFGNRREN